MPPQLCSQGFPCLDGSELRCSGGNLPPGAVMGLWADLWQARVLIKCLLVFEVSLCKTAWQKVMVLHGEHLVTAAMSWRWGEGGRAWKGEGQALSGDSWDPGDDTGGSVDWQGSTLRGKSTQLAKKIQNSNVLEPFILTIPSCLEPRAASASAHLPVKRGGINLSWRQVGSGSHLGCSQLV